MLFSGGWGWGVGGLHSAWHSLWLTPGFHLPLSLMLCSACCFWNLSVSCRELSFLGTIKSISYKVDVTQVGFSRSFPEKESP